MICSSCQMGDGVYPHPVAGRGKVCGDCAAEFDEFTPLLLAARALQQDAKVERRARDKDRARDY